MKKIGLMLALLWVICALSWASSPDARIKGQLIDASTNQVINYADIFLFTMGSEKPLQQTFPDDQGRFSFTKVAPGNYVVMVRLMGYDVFTKNDIILDASSPVDLGKLMMSPLEVGIAEVEVVAEKRQLVYKLDKKVVEASSNMMGGGGSAVDILENTPSIRVDAEGDVTFRGFCANRNRRKNFYRLFTVHADIAKASDILPSEAFVYLLFAASAIN